MYLILRLDFRREVNVFKVRKVWLIVNITQNFVYWKTLYYTFDSSSHFMSNIIILMIVVI